MVTVMHKFDRRASLIFRKQFLVFPIGIVADQLVRNAQDCVRAAVVLFQPYHFDIRIILFKLHNIIETGTPPAIDGLIGISGNRQIRMIDRKPPYNHVLNKIRVLIFIHQNVFESLIERPPQIFVITDEAGHMIEQVVEVCCIRLEESALVGLVSTLNQTAERITGTRGVLLRRNQLILGPTDLVRNFIRGVLKQLNFSFLNRLFQRLSLIVPIIDRKIFLEAHEARVSTEQSGTELMKRSCPNFLSRYQHGKPTFHLVRRFIGERQSHDFPRRHALGNHVGDPVRHDTGLATSWPREDQQSTLDVGGCRFLRAI